jgi:hypothetical protein
MFGIFMYVRTYMHLALHFALKLANEWGIRGSLRVLSKHEYHLSIDEGVGEVYEV